jgi:hypothetical protein
MEIDNKLKVVKPFFGKGQYEVVKSNLDSYDEVIDDLYTTITTMPKTYETDGIPKLQKIAYLHYFSSSSDFYILEKDIEEEQLQAFGFTILNGDMEYAELGYIDIEELKKYVELDFYFDPKPLSEIIGEEDDIDDIEDNDIEEKEDKNFNYKLLSRLKSDCEYFLGNGNRNEKDLWAGNVKDQISEMKRIWNILPKDEKPEWLSMEDIENYEKQMTDNSEKISFKDEEDAVYSVEQDSNGKWTIFSESPDWKRRNEYPSGFATKEDAIMIAKLDAGIETETDPEEAFMWSQEEKIKTEIQSYKNPYEINKAIEKLIDQKNDTYSANELEFISYYSGYGGLEKFGEIGIERMKGLMYEFYTPDAVVKKMWALAYKYGYGTIGDNSVFEPSVGIGAFLKYAPKDVRLVANEINEYSAKICEILYPNAKVELKYFEQNFLKSNSSIKNKTENLDKYSLIIGNPPYGKLDSKYIGMGEGSYSKAGNFTEYFITRGLDLLVQGGLLIYIVGAEQYNGGSLFLDSELSKVKEIIFDKADLLDAYRLPINIFERTGVSSEIVVFKKR